MRIETSRLLNQQSEKIMQAWEARAKAEISQARHQSPLALRDSLPQYIHKLADELSPSIDRTRARVLADFNESTNIGKQHGRRRAAALNYPIDQLVFEYHILRQVICEILEEDQPLLPDEREVIVSSIEQAVNDASTEFSAAALQYQEELIRSIASELRSPVTLVRRNSKTILNQKEFSAQSKRALDSIIENAETLDTLIHKLLEAGPLD